MNQNPPRLYDMDLDYLTNDVPLHIAKSALDGQTILFPKLGLEACFTLLHSKSQDSRGVVTMDVRDSYALTKRSQAYHFNATNPTTSQDFVRRIYDYLGAYVFHNDLNGRGVDRLHLESHMNH